MFLYPFQWKMSIISLNSCYINWFYLQVNQLKELIRRIDLPLHEHLQKHGVDYLQFSFRWMNNLLTREIPLPCTIRLWDTYLAESDGFAIFQLYVCAAFLLHWRERLMLEKDFQGLMILLQNVPTQNWTDSNISVLVAEAYRLKFAFADAPNHLHNAGKSDRWPGLKRWLTRTRRSIPYCCTTFGPCRLSFPI